MLTGWFDEHGYCIYELENPFIKGVYFSGEDGALFTKKWLDYETISIKYKGADLYSEDPEWYEKKWIYFDENSKKYIIDLRISTVYYIKLMKME